MPNLEGGVQAGCNTEDPPEEGARWTRLSACRGAGTYVRSLVD